MRAFWGRPRGPLRLKQRSFRQGTLARAYRKIVADLPRMTAAPKEYHLQCIEKLYGAAALQRMRRLRTSGVSGRDCRSFPRTLASLLDALGPEARLHEPPGEQQRERFLAWFRDCSRRCNGTGLSAMTRLRSQLRKLGTHAAYLETLTADCTPEELELYRQWHSSVPLQDDFALIASDWSARGTLAVFRTYVAQLRRLSGSDDLQRCGNLSARDAVGFARSRSTQSASHLHAARLALLRLTGLSASSEKLLPQALAEENALHARFQELRVPGTALSHYTQLARLLGAPPAEACKASSAEELAERVPRGPQRAKHLALLEAECRGAPEKQERLRALLAPPRTLYERMCAASPSHREILDSVVDTVVLRARSAYPDENMKTQQREMARCACFLEQLHGCDLPTFVRECTQDMARDTVLAFMRQQRPRNDFVRSASEGHSAEGRAGVMLRFMHALAPRLREGATELLNKAKLLRAVPNDRVPADPMVRRTYLPQEEEAMLRTCEGDSKLKLFFLLLSQIGLRINALAHLTFFDLVDEAQLPRKCCTVLEKGRTRRTFVLSSLLRDVVAEYYNTTLVPLLSARGLTHAKAYIFNESKPEQPPKTETLRQWLRKIAQSAGVNAVKVLPHQFRHTITGNLMDAGNSLEVVSKYLGHKSTRTTHNHYWVAEVQELQDLMCSPTRGIERAEPADQELMELELRLLRRKRDKAMELIHTYNTVLGEVKREEGSAAEAVARILQQWPQLGELLRMINDDEESDDEESDESEVATPGV